MKHDHKRGTIKHNACAALVRSPLFRHKVEKLKKGNVSYSRKRKHKNDLDKWQNVLTKYFLPFKEFGCVAQLAEQRAFNP